jgi:hypothetical protein
MHIDDQHIISLFKQRNLLDILKYNILKIAKKGKITKDLLAEILNILRDISNNKNYENLKEFYEDYFCEIILAYEFSCHYICEIDHVNRKK